MHEYSNRLRGRDSGSAPRGGGLIQRACGCGQHVAGGGKCGACEWRDATTPSRTATGPQGGVDAAPVRDVLRSPGQSLDAGTRAFMEPRFGYDFSRVRVHTGSDAAASACSMGALAYTVGHDVVLGSEYRPGSRDGLKLLAHELTHAVQQGDNHAALQGQYRVGPADDAYEREADHVAAELVNGNSAVRVARISGPFIQRAMICSKRLEAPGIGLFANHAYIDDTGRNDCMGASMVGNYAVQTLVSGNFLRGCAAKTATSTDPGKFTPNKKPCEPKPGVSDVSACLLAAYSSYADPSVYSNEALAVGAGGGALAGGAAGAAVGSGIAGPIGGIIGGAVGALGGAFGGARLASPIAGPNSNTFAATLAKACCADATSAGLGWVPGWDHAPAGSCAAKP